MNKLQILKLKTATKLQTPRVVKVRKQRKSLESFAIAPTGFFVSRPIR